MFSAAGLMVPEPSLMSGLIPFIELETGCDVEYIWPISCRADDVCPPRARKDVAPARTGARRKLTRGRKRCLYDDATWESRFDG